MGVWQVLGIVTMGAWGVIVAWGGRGERVGRWFAVDLSRPRTCHNRDGHLMQALHHRVDGAVPERKDEVGDAPLGVDAKDEDELCACVWLKGRGWWNQRGEGSWLACVCVCASKDIERTRTYVSEQKRSIVPHLEAVHQHHDDHGDHEDMPPVDPHQAEAVDEGADGPCTVLFGGDDRLIKQSTRKEGRTYITRSSTTHTCINV